MKSTYLVHINGLLINPSDYAIGTSGGAPCVYFSRAPAICDNVTINDGIHMTCWVADGTTIAFPCNNSETQVDHLKRILQRAYEQREVPAIKDALERLQVLLELTDD